MSSNREIALRIVENFCAHTPDQDSDPESIHCPECRRSTLLLEIAAALDAKDAETEAFRLAAEAAGEQVSEDQRLLDAERAAHAETRRQLERMRGLLQRCLPWLHPKDKFDMLRVEIEAALEESR